MTHAAYLVVIAALAVVVVCQRWTAAVERSERLAREVARLEREASDLRTEHARLAVRLEAIQTAAAELADRMRRGYAPTVQRYGLMDDPDIAAMPGLMQRITEEKYDGT